MPGGVVSFFSSGVGYDLAIEVVAGFILAVGGGFIALTRRAHRTRDLLAERVMGVVRTMHELAEIPLGDETEERDRAKYFSEFIERQMDAELSSSQDLLSDRESGAIRAFRRSVDKFRDDSEGRRRTSGRYWGLFNAIVDAASIAVKALRRHNGKAKAELKRIRHDA
jgi:hypothetical protein